MKKLLTVAILGLFVSPAFADWRMDKLYLNSDVNVFKEEL